MKHLITYVAKSRYKNMLSDKYPTMRLPRRVPWASPAELDQLCSHIYAQDAHHSSRDLAIERVCIAPMPK